MAYSTAARRESGEGEVRGAGGSVGRVGVWGVEACRCLRMGGRKRSRARVMPGRVSQDPTTSHIDVWMGRETRCGRGVWYFACVYGVPRGGHGMAADNRVVSCVP